MEGESEWRPKERKTETEVERCYTKRHEGERSTERRCTRTEKMGNENLMREGKGQRRKRNKVPFNSRRKALPQEQDLLTACIASHGHCHGHHTSGPHQMTSTPRTLHQNDA